MPQIDEHSLRTICGSIAASNFDPTNRIKSIAQIAHEILGATSIIVYQYDRESEQLDILAMPGVPDPELMRGPTDKVIFEWEDPGTESAREGVWLETNEQFDAFMARMVAIAEARGVPKNRIQAGDFRTRQIARNPNKRLATAKIYLWKGLGQTNDHVGQVFFNFATTHSDVIFTFRTRELIRFVCTMIRELLIEKNYHKDSPQVNFSPEYVTTQLNNAFTSNREAGQSAHNRLEREVARIICDAALQITENYGGRSDFIYLIGERLGRVYSSHVPSIELVENSRLYEAVIVSPNSISAQCIGEKKHYAGNYDSSHNYANGQLPRQADFLRIKDRPEFRLAPCRSLLVVPVVHESEVRALIRMASPRKGGFLDEQARAMKTLESLARYGIMLLDERKQRHQMAAALGFYTRGISTISVGVPEDLMKNVLIALGAEWGTFWTIDHIDPDGRGHISQGIYFNKDTVKPVSPETPDCGIRVPGRGSAEPGFTQLLIQSCIQGSDDILCLHIVPDALHGEGTTDSEFLLQRFNAVPFDESADSGSDSDGANRRLPMTADDLKPLALNNNTTAERHSRVAFAVTDETAPRAVVWLKFPSLHEIASWERHYLAGLSKSLAKFLETGNLQRAIWSFRHFIPSLTSDALSKVHHLKSQFPEQTLLGDIDDYMRTMELKSAEVQALLPTPGDTKSPRQIIDDFGRDTIDTYVRRAIHCATDFAEDTSNWSVEYEYEDLPRREVSGLLYLALLNICKNAVLHGWVAPLPNGQECVAIWIRENSNGLRISVANNGEPPDFDPTTERKQIAASSKGAGTGLRVVKALLNRCGGELRYYSDEMFKDTYALAPESLQHCKTFFEFSLPNSNNGDSE